MSTVNTTDVEIVFNDECAIPMCSRSVYAKEFCHLHYQRNRKLEMKGVRPSRFWVQWFDAMNAPASQPRTNPEGVPYRCSVSGCLKTVHSKGWCLNHYMSAIRNR